MAAKIWGLDIGSTGIKAVELARTWQGYRVTDFRFRPVNRETREGYRAEILQGLREIFPEGDRGKKECILSVASHQTMVHHLSLPFQERGKNLQIVKFEVEPLLPIPIDQVVADFYTPPAGHNGKESLVFSVRKTDLQEHLSVMQEAGLDPESMIPEAMALFWLVKSLGKNVSTAALLDLGQEKTTMIIWSGENLALVRSIPLAGEKFTQPSEPAANRNVGSIPLIRLTEEIQKTLLAYEYSPEGQSVEKIFLTGGYADQPGIDKVLEEQLQRPTVLLDMEESSPSLVRNVPREYQHIISIALGAAFGRSTPERMNFRQEEFVSSKKVQTAKTRATLLISYGSILAFLGIAAFTTNLYLKEKRYQDLKAQIRKEFLQAQPGIKKVVNETQQMRILVQAEKARVDALGGLSGIGSPLEIIRQLSLMIEPSWKIRVTELNIEPETVDINGEADSFDAVNQLKAKLDNAANFKEVQLKTAQASSLENVIEFKIQMKRRI